LLLFDLGGVLVDFTGVRDIAALLSKPASRADIVERWSHCPVSYAFGVGEIGPAEFAQRFVRDWGITLEPEQFLREFRSWSRGFLSGARELLDTLRPRFRLGAVSNSNEVHWARNAELGVTQQFEFAVSSHQVGACKPDAAVYEAALQRAGIAPEAVAYFDDLQENVDAATELGMRAFRTEGVEAVRNCVKML